MMVALVPHNGSTFAASIQWVCHIPPNKNRANMITKLVDAENARPVQVVTEPAPRSTTNPTAIPIPARTPARKPRSWAWLGWLLFWAAVGAGVYFARPYYPYIVQFFSA